MGHNRGGDDRKARLRRRKKEMERLARKRDKGGEAKGGAAQPAAAPEPAR